MTKDNWIKAFDDMFGIDVCRGYSGTFGAPIGKDIKSFISQVEKDAIEKTKRECEDLHKNDPTPEEIRELMESVEKETVEKTNKRWVGRINNNIKHPKPYKDLEGDTHESSYLSIADKAYNQALSDLLEDKK